MTESLAEISFTPRASSKTPCWSTPLGVRSSSRFATLPSYLASLDAQVVQHHIQPPSASTLHYAAAFFLPLPLPAALALFAGVFPPLPLPPRPLFPPLLLPSLPSSTCLWASPGGASPRARASHSRSTPSPAESMRWRRRSVSMGASGSSVGDERDRREAAASAFETRRGVSERREGREKE